MKKRNAFAAGFVTLGFMFALIVGFGFSFILFSISLTLTVAEVTQYITFSAARAQLAASDSVDTQEKNARDKFQALKTNPVLAPLYSNGWFEIGPPDVRSKLGAGDFGSDYGSGNQRAIWTGVRTKLTSKIMAITLPVLGRTTQEDGLSTNVMSVLIREPSANECQKYMAVRAHSLLNIPPTRGGSGFAAYAGHEQDFEAAVMEDNGC